MLEFTGDCRDDTNTEPEKTNVSDTRWQLGQIRRRRMGGTRRERTPVRRIQSSVPEREMDAFGTFIEKMKGRSAMWKRLSLYKIGNEQREI